MDYAEALYKLLDEKYAQQSLFETFDDKKIITACIDYLRVNGYRVVKAPKCSYEINKLDDLIVLFYNLLEYKFPGVVSRYINFSKDRRIARLFVDSRMAAGNYDEFYAMKECGLIIETIFDNFDRFNLDTSNLGFWIFGQQNLGWVTDVALQIIREKALSKEEHESDKYSKEVYNWYIKTHGPDALLFDGLKGEAHGEKER